MHIGLLSMTGEIRKAGMVGNLKSGGINVRDYWDLIGEKKGDFCF